MKLRPVIKRLLLSIAVGTVFQGLVFLLAVVLQSPFLALLPLLPGWMLAFAGISDPSTTRVIVGWLLMLTVNNLFYAPAIYFLLWYRGVRQEVRLNDSDSFIKKPEKRLENR